MRGTFLPFSPPLIGEEEISEVVDTLRSDWITTGPKEQRSMGAGVTRRGGERMTRGRGEKGNREVMLIY